jgi:YggT family protein
MFILSNFLVALAQVFDYALWAYSWILLGRVVISWFNADYQNPIVRFLYATTEPVLEPVRRRLPLIAGGLDLSPFVVWFVVLFLQRFLVRSLYELAFALR